MEPLSYETPTPERRRSPVDLILGVLALAVFLLACVSGIPGGIADWWESHPRITAVTGNVFVTLLFTHFVAVVTRVIIVRRRRLLLTSWLIVAMLVQALYVAVLAVSIFEKS